MLVILLLITPLISLQRKIKRVMAVQVLWILLTLVEVIHSEQPVFVPSAAELSDALPKNKQDWLHPVIFNPRTRYNLPVLLIKSPPF